MGRALPAPGRYRRGRIGARARGPGPRRLVRDVGHSVHPCSMRGDCLEVSPSPERSARNVHAALRLGFGGSGARDGSVRALCPPGGVRAQGSRPRRLRGGGREAGSHRGASYPGSPGRRGGVLSSVRVWGQAPRLLHPRQRSRSAAVLPRILRLDRPWQPDRRCLGWSVRGADFRSPRNRHRVRARQGALRAVGRACGGGVWRSATPRSGGPATRRARS